MLNPRQPLGRHHVTLVGRVRLIHAADTEAAARALRGASDPHLGPHASYFTLPRHSSVLPLALIPPSRVVDANDCCLMSAPAL